MHILLKFYIFQEQHLLTPDELPAAQLLPVVRQQTSSFICNCSCCALMICKSWHLVLESVMVRALTYEIKLQPATGVWNRYSKKLVLCFETYCKMLLPAVASSRSSYKFTQSKRKKMIFVWIFCVITLPLDFVIIIKIIYQNAMPIFATMTMKWRRIEQV